MIIEKLSTKLIKPLVPTPPILRHYKTSFIDEFVSFINVGVVVFFSPTTNSHNLNFVSQLQKSLEKTLTRFYPLCGRYVDETHTVDCNDEGAEFIHAKVNIKLQDILAPQVLDAKFVDEFIPYKMGAVDQFSDPLLATQVTVFECGGVAIGVSASHKIVDASSLATFLSSWAAMNREENGIDFKATGFNLSSLFPGRCFRAFSIEDTSDDMSSKYIRKRFSFGESVISKMRAKAFANESIINLRCSKVQLVSAILWKALIDVDHRVRNSNPRESILIQPVNLRGKMASSIPTDSCGNLWVICPTEGGTVETTSQELANCLTKNVKKTINNYSKVYHDSEEGQTVILNSFSQTSVPGSTNVIIITSWCKFPFYEADFGFGKPIWAAPGCVPFANSACLMDDAQGTGVDAHILLDVKDVLYFEEALEKEVNSFAA